MLPSVEIVLLQITCGVNYIHSKNLVHRDIKPENILISKKNPVTIKIADYGLAKPTNLNGSFSQNEAVGTYNWIAPECLLDSEEDENRKKRGTVQSDVFSLGCVFFYYVTGKKHPFGKNPGEINKNIPKNNPVNLKSELNTTKLHEESN